MMKILRSILILFTVVYSPVLLASHHGWDVSEVFSNEDGTLQFVEMVLGANNHNNLKNFSLVAGNSATGEDQVFVIPASISGSTAGDRLLFATAAFQSTFGIIPDFVIPDNFVTVVGGDVEYAGISRSRLA